MHNAEICSAKPNSTKLDISESKTGVSGISRSSDDLGEIATSETEDWKTLLVHYLENPDYVFDRKV
jgi:hypothetical protein